MPAYTLPETYKLPLIPAPPVICSTPLVYCRPLLSAPFNCTLPELKLVACKVVALAEVRPDSVPLVTNALPVLKFVNWPVVPCTVTSPVKLPPVI